MGTLLEAHVDRAGGPQEVEALQQQRARTTLANTDFQLRWSTGLEV